MTAKELQEQINTLQMQLDSLLKQLVSLDKNVKKETNGVGIHIVPDTSWLVAVIDEKDPHHIVATSSLGALLPFQPSFHVPVLAFMETISRLIRVNRMSVKKAQQKTLRLVAGKLRAEGARGILDVKDILEKYKIYSRIKIKLLTTIDFCIVTEGISLGAKILTCDLKMYKSVRKYYDVIYFISDQVVTQESDLARLIRDIQSHKKI